MRCLEVACQVGDAPAVVHHAVLGLRVGHGEAGLGHVQLRCAVLVMQSQEHFGEALGFHMEILGTRQVLRRLALDDAHRFAGRPLDVDPTVIIHAEEVRLRRDQLHVAVGDVRGDQLGGELRIAFAIQRIDEGAVPQGVHHARSRFVHRGAVFGAHGLQVHRGADAPSAR
ncbi:hypothetical protein D9M69_511620 [compost metagenome]